MGTIYPWSADNTPIMPAQIGIVNRGQEKPASVGPFCRKGLLCDDLVNGPTFFYPRRTQWSLSARRTYCPQRRDADAVTRHTHIGWICNLYGFFRRIAFPFSCVRQFRTVVVCNLDLSGILLGISPTET